MPHGYRCNIDADDRLKYMKRHKDGATTKLDITKQVPGEDWEIEVRDPRGNVNLGTFGTKTEAKQRAMQWMRDNPKGVPAGNGSIAGMGGGIPGTDGNGLF